MRVRAFFAAMRGVPGLYLAPYIFTGIALGAVVYVRRELVGPDDRFDGGPILMMLVFGIVSWLCAASMLLGRKLEGASVSHAELLSVFLYVPTLACAFAWIWFG